MKQYKPIVIRIKYYTATDVLTESVGAFLSNGKGKEFDVGWIFETE